MARDAPSEEPKTEKKPKTPSRDREVGRVRAAWSVLMGERLVPLQLQAEWVEYKLIFDDILKRLSAQLARQAKAEKDRLKKLIPDDDPREQLELPRGDRKAEVRAKAAAARGMLRPRGVMTNGEN